MKANFVVHKSKNLDEKNFHWWECKRANRPFVFISPARKFAWVELDMWPVNCDLDDATRDAIYETMREQGLPPQQLRCGHTICRAERVPITMAKKLAEQIYEIAFNAIPHLTPLEEKWKVMNSVPAAIVNNV